MDCRGTETRKRIVTEYKVEPVAHIKLLANQTKHSDAGATIEDEYYIFTAIKNSDGTKEIIQCGMGAARDLLKILGHAGLPLFNPLKVVGMKQSSNVISNNHETINEWDATAQQLYNAIMWLIIAWDAKPDTPLFEFKDDILKYKQWNPFDWKIKRVNTTIKNGGKGKTLTQIVNEFGKNNNIKDSVCDFSLLRERMNRIVDTNGNIVESFF